MTAMEQPNWSATQSRASFRTSGGLISRLADPRIVAVSQAYLKEFKMVEDRGQAGRNKSVQEVEMEKENRKSNEKQKRSGRQQQLAARRRAKDRKTATSSGLAKPTSQCE